MRNVRIIKPFAIGFWMEFLWFFFASETFANLSQLKYKLAIKEKKIVFFECGGIAPFPSPKILCHWKAMGYLLIYIFLTVHPLLKDLSDIKYDYTVISLRSMRSTRCVLWPHVFVHYVWRFYSAICERWKSYR